MTYGSLILIALIVIFLILFFRFIPVALWISALAANVKIGIWNLVGMRLRRVVPARIVNPLIKSVKAGLDIPINKLEAHYLAGGNVDRVVNSLIAAQRANIPLEFERAAAIDLAGRDVLEAVQMSVNPKVIETPIVAAIAKDGIELKAKAKVTVLEIPDKISHTVLSKGLEAGTAFEILSIDIADVDVGRNIGAQLQADQAEADKKIAQAKAEERRAMAIAAEQEMKAQVQEMRAKVVEAEAEVPKAMAAALREGKLGVMDYYNMQNVISDTRMREAIAAEETGK